jgi:hypothetical protein
VILLGSVRADTPRAYLPSSLNPIEESRMRALQSLGVVSSFAIASVAIAQNAVQWRVEDGGNGHWYALVVPATRVTNGAAVSAAHAMGGALASIGSEQENQIVFQIAAANPSLWTLAWPGATQITGPWLGATYSGGVWAWMDGTAWSFARWAPGEPNYLSTETAVLYMGPAGGAPTNQWNNIEPSYPNWGFIVEWSADCNQDGEIDYGQILSGQLRDINRNGIPDCCESAEPCQPQAVQWTTKNGGNGHWYELVVPRVRVTSSEARAIALSRGGDLASLGSISENQFVFELASADATLWTLAWPGAFQITGPWIGADYSTGAWRWSDGTPWSFTNWAPGEPNYLATETSALFMGPSGGPPTDLWNNIEPLYPNWGYVIEWSSDCNGDGEVDFGQIQAGLLADFDLNNVPDCCEFAPYCVFCAADIDRSGEVNGIDLASVLGNWGTSGGTEQRNDVTADGIVDGADLAEVLNSWGPCH